MATTQIVRKLVHCAPWGSRGISNKAAIIRRNVMRKVKKGVDRLPSQGLDPAARFKHGWRIAAAAVLERYPLVVPDLDPFDEEYRLGKFVDEQKRSRPMPVEWFLTEKDKVEGMSFVCPRCPYPLV